MVAVRANAVSLETMAFVFRAGSNRKQGAREMATEIKVPPLGESIVEATVGRWLKREGEEGVEGEPVVELETEKVNMEVTANGSGVLGEIIKREGETV